MCTSSSRLLSSCEFQQLLVSDEDIRRQESRVLDARKKLQELMK